MSEDFKEIFKVGEHKNSLGRSAEVLEEVLQDHKRLAELYACISDDDAWVRMRAIDTLEKVLRQHPDWVQPYLDDMFENLLRSNQPSIQWHLAQIFRFVELTDKQKTTATNWLAKLLSTKDVDWIVAANSMDTLLQFIEDGLITKTKFKELLEIQLGHKSKSVAKRANKYLDQLRAG